MRHASSTYSGEWSVRKKKVAHPDYACFLVKFEGRKAGAEHRFQTLLFGLVAVLPGLTDGLL